MIKQLRLKRDMSQESVARFIDISTEHYRQIEKNQTIPNVLTGLKLAELFKIDPYELWFKRKS